MRYEYVMRTPPEGGEAREMLAISRCIVKIPSIVTAAIAEMMFTMYCQAESATQITITIGDDEQQYNVGTGWQRIELPADSADDVSVTAAGNTDVYLYKAQLETGNRATDWKPAPEDAEEAIDEARNSAEAAQNRADEAYDELNSRLLLDTDGLHVGKQDDAADRRNEILIRTGSNPTIDFIFDGVAEASIAKDYHRFGNMEIRVPSVGGFIFQAVGGGE